MLTPVKPEKLGRGSGLVAGVVVAIVLAVLAAVGFSVVNNSQDQPPAQTQSAVK